jgi:hypothetical protein
MDKYGNLSYEEIMAALERRDARLTALGAKKVKYGPLKDQISRFDLERVSE